MGGPVRLGIRPMVAPDWPAVRRIYLDGIATGNATFDTDAPEWPVWDAAHRSDCRLVAVLDGSVVGWLALMPWSGRSVYSGVAWESIYVAADARGRGIGRALLEAGIAESERCGVWTLLAGVEEENTPSLALHERLGFRRLGVQERIGRDATGRWRDVVLLERRSGSVGG